MKAVQLKWHADQVPHLVLDVVRECNITCRGCYNVRDSWRKDLAQVRADLDLALSRRRLETITISGGEPTLHPGLPEIVREITARGVRAAVCTNGVLVDDPLVRELAAAGLKFLMLHIQSDQARPDLPPGASLAELRALWERKVKVVARNGVLPAIAYTVFPDRLDEYEALVRFMLTSPELRYLFVTFYADTGRLTRLVGSIEGGMRVEGAVQCQEMREGAMDPVVDELLARMKGLGIEPFSWLGTQGGTKPRWYLFWTDVVFGRGEPRWLGLKASWFERASLWLGHRLNTRAKLFYDMSGPMLRVHLVLNALLGGRTIANLRHLFASLGARVMDKHIAFQRPPEVQPDGRVALCENCPDAIVRDGRLVPPCLADRLTDE